MASSGNTSSAVVTENDSVGSSSVSWNFASALPQQPGNETTTVPSPRARDVPDRGHCSMSAEYRSNAGGCSMPAGHCATVGHCSKMDKATILSDAVRYIKEQQQKLRALEDRTAMTRSVVVPVNKPCVGGGFKSPCADAAPALPEIEVAISESSVMVRIHCEDGKGRLVRLLAEVEGLHLSITHTNVIPFPACTVIITIVAKVHEGLKITTEDIVGKLESALRLKNLEAAKT